VTGIEIEAILRPAADSDVADRTKSDLAFSISARNCEFSNHRFSGRVELDLQINFGDRQPDSDRSQVDGVV